MPAALPPAMEAMRQAILVPPPAYVQPDAVAAGASPEALFRRAQGQVSMMTREARSHNMLLRSASNLMIAMSEAGTLDVTLDQINTIISDAERAVTGARAQIEQSRVMIEANNRKLRNNRAALVRSKQLSSNALDSMILVHDALVYTWERALIVQAELDPDAKLITFSSDNAAELRAHLEQIAAV